MSQTTESWSAAVDQAMPLAEELLSKLRKKTPDGMGVSRETYGTGKQTWKLCQ